MSTYVGRSKFFSPPVVLFAISLGQDKYIPGKVLSITTSRAQSRTAHTEESDYDQSRHAIHEAILFRVVRLHGLQPVGSRGRSHITFMTGALIPQCGCLMKRVGKSCSTSLLGMPRQLQDSNQGHPVFRRAGERWLRTRVFQIRIRETSLQNHGYRCQRLQGHHCSLLPGSRYL